MAEKKVPLLGATLLVSGTTVGAGMLALPITAAECGLLPMGALFFLLWFVMFFSALFLLEAVLWYEKPVNIITIAKDTYGVFGSAIAWGLYLFLLYALTTAYLTGFAPVFQQIILKFSIEIPLWLASFPLLFLFVIGRSVGVRLIDRLNRFLLLGGIFLFLLILGVCLSRMDMREFWGMELSLVPSAAAVIACAFGYHVIIPSLVPYLKHNRSSVEKSLFWGSLFPLLFYILWTFGVVGAVSRDILVDEGKTLGNAVLVLGSLVEIPGFGAASDVFALILIVTSFLGVAMSLFDVLKDGLNLDRENFYENCLLFSFTLLPPLVALFYNPYIFISALELAGGLGVYGLLILFPAALVLKGRRYKKGYYQAPGGVFAPWAVIIVTSILTLLYLGSL